MGFALPGWSGREMPQRLFARRFWRRSRWLIGGVVKLMGRGIFRLGFGRGATQLGFVDVLTAVILVGILFWVAELQSAAYKIQPAAASRATRGAAGSH